MTTRPGRRRPDHDPYRLLAAAAVDGRIDADDAAVLEAHLATCPECRADQQAMLEDHRWLAASRAAAPAPRVRERVLVAARSKGIVRVEPPQRPWAALLAAGLVVGIVGVGLFAAFRPPTTPGGSPSGSTAATETAKVTTTTPASTPIPLGRELPAGSCAPRIADLSAWWPGDDDGAELVAGRSATLHGGATIAPGVVGQAFEFDGQTGYATVALDPALRLGTADMTIMLWVRFDRTTGDQVLLEQWRDPTPGAPSAGWTFTKRADDTLLFTSGSNGVGEGAETPPLAFEPGVWHHLAVWRSASAMKIFVDDQPIGGGGIAGSQIDIGVDLPLFIGRRGDDRGFYLAGALDEIHLVIGRALTETEIRASYLAGSSGTCPQ